MTKTKIKNFLARLFAVRVIDLGRTKELNKIGVVTY